MESSSDSDRKFTQEMLSQTEIDAGIALRTLLENIRNASMMLVQPDMEVLGNIFGDKQLKPVQSMYWSSKEERQEAETTIWKIVTSGQDRSQGRIRAVLNGLINFVTRRHTTNREEQRDAILRAGRISHILGTTDALEKAITAAREEQRTLSLPGDTERLKTLLRQAELVSYYTRLWGVYENAWRQHVDTGTPLIEAVKAADAVVHGLYEHVGSKQQLRLRLPGQQLVAMFYESRVVTRVSRFPVQYIAAPYWGHKLIWNWLAFAHEIGHHAWANIGEEAQDHSTSRLNIGDELFVHLTVYLLRKMKTKERVMWSKWMEEMFADLFCLLLIGPAAIHSMQHMFFALPPQNLGQYLKTEDPKAWLRRAYDEEHPIPYLRVYLNVEMLRLLDPQRFASEIDSISRQWEAFFPGPEQYVYTFSSDKIPVEDMRKIGSDMLGIMLNTPLFSLGRKNNVDEKRTLKEVFFDKEPSNLEQKIEKAQQTLIARNWEECKSKLSRKEFEIRHLLAALQFEFERVTSDSSIADKEQALQELSSRILGVLKDHGDEQLFQELQDKKQEYFQVGSD